jgi:hypothetical protein
MVQKVGPFRSVMEELGTSSIAPRAKIAYISKSDVYVPTKHADGVVHHHRRVPSVVWHRL